MTARSTSGSTDSPRAVEPATLQKTTVTTLRYSRPGAMDLAYDAEMDETRYDAIGSGYAATRREDPRIAAMIHEALGGARTVVNVGAGSGSHQPPDRGAPPIQPSRGDNAPPDPSPAPAN